MNYEDKYKKLVDAIKILKENRTSDKDFQDWVKDNVPKLQEEPESERIKNCLLYLASVEDIANDAFESYNVDYDSVSNWIKNRMTVDQVLDQRTIEDIVYYLEDAKKHYASTIGLEDCIGRLRSLESR